MVIRLHKKRTLLVIGFLYFLFQLSIWQYTSGVINKLIGYSDEVMECFLIALILLSFCCRSVRLIRVECWMLGCYGVFLLMGVLSSIIYPLQSWILNLSDILVCSRFLVFYFAARILLPPSIDYRKLLRALAKTCRIVAVVLFLLAVHDILFDPIFPKRDFRYFMYAIQLCFPHPTYMAVACATCACVLMAAMEYDETKKERRNNLLCITMLLILTALTLRSKALAAAACMTALYFVVVKWRIRSRVLVLGSGAALAAMIGMEQLIYYYTYNVEEFVRARLLRDAITLASKHFPFGTGFATFGSAIAANYYSPLYTELGFHLLHGGSPSDPKYMCDTFWGTVIAQNGWIGTLAFIGVVAALVVIVLKMETRSKYIYWSALSIMIYKLISSTSEPAFFNPTAGVLFAFLGLLVNICLYTGNKTDPGRKPAP